MDNREKLKASAVKLLQYVADVSSDTDNNEKKCPDLENIETNDLFIPEKIVKFVIEMYFDSFESVIEGIGDVRADMLGEVVSKIETAKKNLVYAYENPDYKEEKLRKSHNDLTDVTSRLEEKIRQYASELERVNNRGGISGLIFSPFDLTKVKNTMKMSKTAFTAYFETIFLLTIIDNTRRANGNLFIEQGKKFIYELEDKKYISLFLDYDKDKNEIWNAKRMQGLIDKASLISAGFDDYIKQIQ